MNDKTSLSLTYPEPAYNIHKWGILDTPLKQSQEFFKLRMVVHAYNFSILEAEAGELRVWEQYGLLG